MAFRSDPVPTVALALVMVGCSPHAEARPVPNTPAKSATDSGQGNAATGNAAPNGPASASAPVRGTVATDAPPPPPPPDPKTGELPKSLPELKLSLVGMHIGGGPNDAETKRPFIAAIEQGFDAMRTCYSRVAEPEKGGTFGVDLRVERAGGHPQLQAVRTVMKGDEFKACLEGVFRELEFVRPVKGPTVLSASVRFSLEP